MFPWWAACCFKNAGCEGFWRVVWGFVLIWGGNGFDGLLLEGEVLSALAKGIAQRINLFQTCNWEGL